jgi:very-short-patch-repair endonuclease
MNSADSLIELNKAEVHTESEFEKQVMQRLVAAGCRVVTQWQVGAYRIDLAVEGGGNRLAIECDGDRWHPIEKIPEDMERQAILERLKWKFVRLRGSEFFRDPETAMQPVFKRLNELQIPPEGNQPINSIVDTELKDRVLRRAELLQKEFDTPGDTIEDCETFMDAIQL